MNFVYNIEMGGGGWREGETKFGVSKFNNFATFAGIVKNERNVHHLCVACV